MNTNQEYKQDDTYMQRIEHVNYIRFRQVCNFLHKYQRPIQQYSLFSHEQRLGYWLYYQRKHNTLYWKDYVQLLTELETDK